MFAILVLIFVTLPVLELYILFRIASLTDFWTTFALVMVTGVIGAWLAKRQGLQTLLKIQRSLNEGKIPGDALVDGAMILVAAVLLVTPGILTDLFGFSLLLPPCRKLYRRCLRYLPMHVSFTSMHATTRHSSNEWNDSDIVQGSARPVNDDSLPEH